MLKKSNSWHDATVVTGPTTAPNCYKFPKGLAFVNPAMVRKKAVPTKSKGKSVVAHSVKDPYGGVGAKGIIIGSEMFTKLDCENNAEVEYKKATFWNVLWAKKLTAILAALGLLIAAAQAVSTLTSLIPTKHRAAEVTIAWLLAAVMIIGASVVAGITVKMASSD